MRLSLVYTFQSPCQAPKHIENKGAFHSRLVRRCPNRPTPSRRTTLAHASFLENLQKSRPEWKRKNIFTAEGWRIFRDDMEKIGDHFLGPKTPETEHNQADTAP